MYHQLKKVTILKKDKATNKKCYFYDPKYDSKCSACKIAHCSKCNFYVDKSNKRQASLDKEFKRQRELLYYPNGVRK